MKARRLLYFVLAVGMLCALLGTGHTAARATEANPGGGAGLTSPHFKVVIWEAMKSADPSATLVWLLKVLLTVLGLSAGDLALSLLLIRAGRPGSRRSD
jgi:hypothetical protein